MNNTRIINQTPETWAGGNSRAAAEADGAEGTQSAPWAADPAGGGAGGGWGAGGLHAEELHRCPAPRHGPNPAGPRHLWIPHTDLRLASTLHAQVSLTHTQNILPVSSYSKSDTMQSDKMLKGISAWRERNPNKETQAFTAPEGVCASIVQHSWENV